MSGTKLKALLKPFEVEVRGSKEVEITGITADSRTAAPGSLFIAKKGTLYDGTQYIMEAVQAGAVAIVTDFFDPFLKQTQIVCSHPADLEAKLAARFYGNPSAELFVIGVTGTKGKTTTSYLIHHLFEGLKIPCGLVGTVETIVGKNRFDSTLTTHGAIQNQKLLREMVLQGCKAAVLEVSSHGLIQKRVDEIDFDVALFTNLTPDHLDYHKTTQEYAFAKKKLFERGAMAIVNADSPWAEFMAQEAITYGIERQADVRAQEIQFTSKGIECVVNAYGQTAHLHSFLLGRFNVYNLLAAIAVGLEHAPLASIVEILSCFSHAPGRLERIANEQGFEVFVDFAHSGEALENVLATLREIAKRRLLVIFGCGGDRDSKRRTSMACAAEKWADLTIVTNDNPRSEDPQEICRQILTGFQHPGKVFVELDRKKAIERAISFAEPGDIVLIAGKGHEKTQIFAHQTLPFDDVAVAKEALFCHSP